MAKQIIPVEVQKAIEATEIMVKSYDNYIVSTQENYAGAGGDLQQVKTKIKELTELRLSLTRPIDESKKRIMEFFSKPLEVLDKVKTAIDGAMRRWLEEQERIRRAEEQRLVEIQRKAAEELQRQAREAERKASKMKTAKAREAAQVLAEELKEKAVAVEAIAPVVESRVETVSGVSVRDNWLFLIIDANKIPREYMMPDEKLIGSIGKATRGQKKIEGIEFYAEKVISSRR